MLPHKIRELLIIGFNGTTLNAQHPLTTILPNNIGGVIAFDIDWRHPGKIKNIESIDQIQNLNQQIKSHNTNAWRAVDSEGGIDWDDAHQTRHGVNRLKPAYGFKSTLSAKQMGELFTQNDIQAIKENCQQIANNIKQAGFNFTMAPVVDLVINPQSPGLAEYKRCFSDNPNTVIKIAEYFIQACQAENIQCALKHFPGLGSQAGDTHHGLVDITNTWNETELKPYSALAKQCGMIMSSHAIHKGFSPWPASLAPELLTDLLRHKMSFNGVIISDDLNMQGALDVIKAFYQTDNKDFILEKLIQHAFNAGNDVLVFGFQLQDFATDFVDHFVDVVLKLIRENKLAESQIVKSHQRIKTLKSVALSQV